MVNKVNIINSVAPKRLSPVKEVKSSPTGTGRFRRFVSVVHANTEFQVLEGPPEWNQPIMSGGDLIQPLERKGDKFATFVGGFCFTDDEDIIEWLEEYIKHHDDIFDADDPRTEARIKFSDLKTDKSWWEGQDVGDIESVNERVIKEAVEQGVRQRLIDMGIDPDTFGIVSSDEAEKEEDEFVTEEDGINWGGGQV